MQHRSWRVVNVILGIVIALTVLLIMVRKVDGTGHVETLESRLMALLVLAIFVVLIVVIEWVVYLFMKRRR